jgi:outer membrane protein TolC
MITGYKKRHLLFAQLVFFCVFCTQAYSLTIEEALQLAIDKLPSYKAAELKVKSSEALYNATLSPYLPSIDASFAKSRHYTQSLDYDTKSYGVTLSYLLFDGGRREASRDIGRLNLSNQKEELRKSLLDIRFLVKNAFYRAIATRDTVEQRKIQLEDARKDLEVAEGRHKFGVARLLDVLQASVRHEQAKFNLIQGEGDHSKALSELNSLIGLPYEAKNEIKGSLESEMQMPRRDSVMEAVILMPELIQLQNLKKISQNNKSLVLSEFYPSLSASASYTRTEGRLQNNSSLEDKAIGIVAVWNIFELGKFFKKKSAYFEEGVSEERYNELKRTLQLDAFKAYEDLSTAVGKLQVAQKQLELAEHNYKQAFGEYKVGKADILSLVQAESTLSNAREQVIGSKLALILAKTALERAAGVEKLELLIAR